MRFPKTIPKPYQLWAEKTDNHDTILQAADWRIDVSKFTTSLHNRNRVGKTVLYNARMQIENAEIEAWMPDWSPSGTEPLDTYKNEKLDPFQLAQRATLLQLREMLIDALAEVATSSRSSDGEALSLKTHQADAATEAYDRDFALSVLAHEKNALYEIDEALRRIDVGTYGFCEMSGRPIPRDRLEAIPFARFTVECQSQIEKENKALARNEERYFYLLNTGASEQQPEEEVPSTDENQFRAA